MNTAVSADALALDLVRFAEDQASALPPPVSVTRVWADGRTEVLRGARIVRGAARGQHRQRGLDISGTGDPGRTSSIAFKFAAPGCSRSKTARGNSTPWGRTLTSWVRPWTACRRVGALNPAKQPMIYWKSLNE